MSRHIGQSCAVLLTSALLLVAFSAICSSDSNVDQKARASSPLLQLSDVPSHELLPNKPVSLQGSVFGNGSVWVARFSYPRSQSALPRVAVRIRNATTYLRVPVQPDRGSRQTHVLSASGEGSVSAASGLGDATELRLSMTIMQPCSAALVTLPSRLSHACITHEIATLLCVDEDCQPASPVGNFEVHISSPSLEHFELDGSLDDVMIQVGETRVVKTSLPEPSYLKFDFPPGVDDITVKVRSESNIVCRVSLQNASCPVFDRPTNVLYEGIHQTMRKRAELQLSRKQLGSEVAIVFVVDTASEVGKGGESCSYGVKPISVTVEKSPSIDSYTTPIMILVLTTFIVPYITVLLFSCFETLRKRTYREPTGSEVDEATETAGPLLLQEEQRVSSGRGPRSYGAASVVRSHVSQQSETVAAADEDARSDTTAASLVALEGSSAFASARNSVSNEELAAVTSSNDADASSEAAAAAVVVSQQPSHALQPHGRVTIATSVHGWFDGSEDREQSIRKYRGRHPLVVSDLARKLPPTQDKKFYAYATVLASIIVFYLLPVTQFVYEYLRDFNLGQQDVCYYNFGCSRPLWRFFSFNSVFSNFGYVSLGLLFLLIVWSRDRLYRSQGRSDQDARTPDEAVGLPRHYGIFYAVGLAIVAEGIFSACYHVCPTPINFQFDTSFMYTISCLFTVALYQRRHSDSQANAHVFYICLAALVFVVVVGVYWASVAFYIVVFVAALPVMYFVVLQIYYIGAWQCRCTMSRPIINDVLTEPIVGMVDWSKNCLTCGLPSDLRFPRRQSRAILLIFGCSATFVTLMIGVISNPSDAPTFFLALFVINYLLYCGYYIFMKWRHERIGWQPALLFLATVSFMFPALYFFESRASDWYLSPQLSREENTDCQVLGFYDSHDVWHILSAFSLFFNAMCLLSLDDDLVLKPRTQIKVF